MKIWFLSDTHNHHRQLQIPPGIDVVIHCGDESSAWDEWINELESRSFFDWYGALDIPTKIFIPGNHSTAIERGVVKPSDYPDISFLIHQGTEFETGFGAERNRWKIFGTPYTPQFFNWSYMRPRDEIDLEWQTIPTGVDILISHGPPEGILDSTRDAASNSPLHVGSHSLASQVFERIRPRIHAFGHIHDEPGIRNFGAIEKNGILFVNCSCCNLGSKLVNHGIVLTIRPDGSILV